MFPKTFKKTYCFRKKCKLYFMFINIIMEKIVTSEFALKRYDINNKIKEEHMARTIIAVDSFPACASLSTVRRSVRP